jgi:toluene monooxygenase system ferredoxin subunit
MAWKALCKVDEVEPASMKSVTVDGTEFLVLRGEEDDLLVVPPKCPHMDTPLCDGFFDGALLTCSQHLWQWSVKDGGMQGIAEAPLAVYPSKRENGVLCIDFERELRYQHEVEG